MGDKKMVIYQVAQKSELIAIQQRDLERLIDMYEPEKQKNIEPAMVKKGIKKLGEIKHLDPEQFSHKIGEGMGQIGMFFLGKPEETNKGNIYLLQINADKPANRSSQLLYVPHEREPLSIEEIEGKSYARISAGLELFNEFDYIELGRERFTKEKLASVSLPLTAFCHKTRSPALLVYNMYAKIALKDEVYMKSLLNGI